MSSLTKKAFLEKASARFRWVDIEGWGTIGLRSCPYLQYSHRWVTYTNPETGDIIPEERAKQTTHEIIDQVMIDEKTPMFTEDDFDTIAALDPERLAPVSLAIREFNAEDQKKVSVA